MNMYAGVECACFAYTLWSDNAHLLHNCTLHIYMYIFMIKVTVSQNLYQTVLRYELPVVNLETFCFQTVE